MLGLALKIASEDISIQKTYGKRTGYSHEEQSMFTYVLTQQSKTDLNTPARKGCRDFC